MVTAMERLESLLDDKDDQIYSLQQKLEDLEIEMDASWDWARHTQIESDNDSLPVPRLEIRYYETIPEYGCKWVYSLVYRHLLGSHVVVPLGSTSQNGGNGSGLYRNGTPNLPFRDSAHINHDMENFNLPAFAIIGDKVWVLPLEK